MLANNGQQEYGRLKESGEIVPPHAIYSWRRCTGAAAASDKKGAAYASTQNCTIDNARA